MKWKLLLILLLLLSGGFVYLGLKDQPVTQQQADIPLKADQFTR